MKKIWIKSFCALQTLFFIEHILWLSMCNAELSLTDTNTNKCVVYEVINYYSNYAHDNIHTRYFIFEDLRYYVEECVNNTLHPVITANFGGLGFKNAFRNTGDGNIIFIVYVFSVNTIAEILHNVPQRLYQKHFIVMITDILWDMQEIQHMFQQIWKLSIINIIVVAQTPKYFAAFTYYPFSDSQCNRANASLPSQFWKIGDEIPYEKLTLLWKNGIRNLYGCNLRMTTLEHPPDVILKSDGNIIYEVDGVEGQIALALAKYMNSTPVFLFPSDYMPEDRTSYTRRDVLEDIANKRSDIAFSSIYYSPQRLKLLDLSVYYKFECITWAVPTGIGKVPPVYGSIIIEFSNLMWFLILISLIVAILFFSIAPQHFCHVNSKDKIIFRDIILIVTFVFITLRGSPVSKTPTSTPIRLFYGLFLLFCLLISMAYQANLGSILTLPWPINQIHTGEEVIQLGMRIGGDSSISFFLKQSHTDKITQEILGQFEQVDIKQGLRMIADTHNFSLILPRNMLLYFLAENLLQYNWKNGSFHILKACYISTYPAFILRKGSPYTKAVNLVIQRLVEGGIVAYWEQRYVFPYFPPKDKGFDILHLLGAFTVVIFGTIIALTVFILELGTNYYKKRFLVSKQHRPSI